MRAFFLLLWIAFFLVRCGNSVQTLSPSDPEKDPGKTAQAPSSSDSRKGRSHPGSPVVSPPGGGEPLSRQPERIILTRHARCRMDCRHITEKEIREVLVDGTINYAKSEPHSHPDPKYAMEGYTKERQHLRIVFAVPSPESLVVVTCIEMGVEWQCDCH